MPPFNQFSQHGAVPMQASPHDNLDVTISIGFLRGIFMQEQNVGMDWQNQTELDPCKVVVIARNETHMVQADEYITSAPLERPKPVGDWMNYTALFPLKGSNPPTKMSLPNLIHRDLSSSEYTDVHGQYKRESIDLLITLIFGNEAITLGKARLLITGEEVRTKQSDLPIDISKDSIVKAQKKTQFPMKRMTNLPSGRDGELEPVSFKYDRRRRKFQIETDAVLRVFYKVSPHDPFKVTKNPPAKPINVAASVSGAHSFFSSIRPRRKLFGRSGTSTRSSDVGPRNKGNSDIPRTIGGGYTEFGPSVPPPPPQQMPFTHQHSIGSNISGGSGGGRPDTALTIPNVIPHSPSMGAATSTGVSMRRGFNQSSMMGTSGMSMSGIQSAPPNMPPIQNMSSMRMNNSNGMMQQSRNPPSTGSYGRSPSAPRSLHSNGSYYGGSTSASGRMGTPSGGGSSIHQSRSQSTPRMRYGSMGVSDSGYGTDQPSAYGGSSYGYSAGVGGGGGANSYHGASSSSRRGAGPGAGGGYGGSSYGGSAPRKMNFGPSSMSQGYGSQGYGGGMGGGGYGGGRSRSQSPYVSRNF